MIRRRAVISSVLALAGLSALCAKANEPRSAEQVPATKERAVKERVMRFLSSFAAAVQKPDRDIDLLGIKLLVDEAIEPTGAFNAAQLRGSVRAIADDILQALPRNASAIQKLDRLRTSLYKAGPWNDGVAFSYNMEDPLGKELKTKLLHNYLATKKGNCVSMPLLFLLVGNEVGLKLSLSRAPEHLFVKFEDESGKSFNVETTSGGNFARDEWIRKNLPMSDEAIESGIYLRAMSNKSAAVAIAETYLEFLDEQKQYQAQGILARELLKMDPRNVVVMLHLCSSDSNVAKEYTEKYKFGGVGVGQMMVAEMYMQERRSVMYRIRKMGWTMLPD